MNLRAHARRLIDTLTSKKFYAECPSCAKTFRLRDAGLFYQDDFTPQAKKLYEERLAQLAERRRELREARRRIPSSSEVTAQAVNIGFILERIAPILGQFRFQRNDCRALFDPIDYIIFEGLSSKGIVSRILFTDIKTGAAGLTSRQKEIRTLVEHKKVEWDTYSLGGRQ